ncbi:hypothetical protein EOA32_07850 [Mesorhizobium sp. M1A.F.Ca.ET.072.01.1.1]|uniref:hypothetical protein n=1 Tax=Mesorhizobium sp. M1A.F.Ca.ET.072.01.1.1 TaxID=2496753 RepID=UPI000FD1E8A0|nr:hypothetical protein [Mesorhizobium sp. M1A.F.Ca.ET.072.01.1.1]RUW53860.1 hypothetical protein EOA32_07850 [Mesorhizobium sp. M1A.F.Ca.ET.072.01.1.1]TIU97286.1 MAG: hypothetical protein E5W04_26430 [Mesorhizobium sp.]
MRVYRVEEMVGDMPISHRVASAATPWEAARKATGKDVTARTDERFWVRVEGTRAVYKYAFKSGVPGRL